MVYIRGTKGRTYVPALYDGFYHFTTRVSLRRRSSRQTFVLTRSNSRTGINFRVKLTNLDRVTKGYSTLLRGDRSRSTDQLIVHLSINYRVDQVDQ